MRILTKFKDYYDGLSAYDQEPTPVYVRHTTEMMYSVFGREYDLPDKLLPLTQHCRHNEINLRYQGYHMDSFLTFRRASIFFCGKIYRFVILMGDGGKDCFYTLSSLQRNPPISSGNDLTAAVFVVKYSRLSIQNRSVYEIRRDRPWVWRFWKRRNG